MTIKLTDEEVQRVLSALRQQVGREAQIAVDLGITNTVAVSYAYLADEIEKQILKQEYER